MHPTSKRVQETCTLTVALIAPGRYKVRVKHLLFTPAGKPKSCLPLLVFLHGSGERGTDLEKVKSHGPPKLIEDGKKFRYFVLSPLCPKRRWWRPDDVVRLIDAVIAEHPVDADRVYLTGISMGGYGTWATAARHPDRFAALVPICGGGDPKTVDSIKHIPTWVFHGARDEAVPLESSQRMVDALKELGSKVKFTVYPDAEHDSWTETYENPKLYKWLLKQRRKR
jgi:predicted peptidase